MSRIKRRQVTCDDWQKGIALLKQVYEITRSLPAEERFGLRSQMRRAGCRFRQT
ncbi:MAG: four helix bundle protein [Acidobacteria bacterium]|nr:four helix bundle protein [Acidobacteriota bacterium]